MGTHGGDAVIDPNLTLQVIRELITEFDELRHWQISGRRDAELLINKQALLLHRFVGNFEDLDKWMARGGELPGYWNSQTRIDRVTPMMCCGEPMAVILVGMLLLTGQDHIILVWHCSECGHWEPYEPHPMDPDATVPNCLCGAAMVDVPPSQWDPSKFRIVMCTECGAYDTWWATRHHSGSQRDTGHTTECAHETCRLIDAFNEECLDCGIRGPVDPHWDIDDGQG
ncbi:hypothetical protein VMT65_12175 [Nocardia sp. CDC153]|uniref:hypothetical protein n=1 Tax=Nocardia sp. CDC153 TaxID=3112167 RepID=UPI002DB66147|nr:hypothetical protein [Nocardia sp. CDC153]MEC3953787.1 hypothetical protein [Nocardia sp. CDC153]